MPKPLRTRFNAHAASKGLVKVLDKVAPPAIILTLAGGVIGLVVNFGNAIERSVELNQEIVNLRTMQIDGASYKLSDAYQVETEDGQIDYDVNFRSQTVAIDGPHEADDIRLFDEFNRTDFILSNLDAGISISKKIIEHYDRLSEAEQQAFNNVDQYADMLSDARTFLDTYQDGLKTLPLETSDNNNGSDPSLNGLDENPQTDTIDDSKTPAPKPPSP